MPQPSGNNQSVNIYMYVLSEITFWVRKISKTKQNKFIKPLCPYMYQGLSLVHVKQQFDMCPAYQLSYTMMSIINFEQWLYLSLKMDIYFT